jgi:acyl-CoA reductase-like NAD-dependent aldehyde dehydrogenase
VPVCACQDEEEFLDYVTQSNYGQQLSLFGRDPDQFVKLIDPLANQVCRINLKCSVPAGAGFAALSQVGKIQQKRRFPSAMLCAASPTAR